MNMNMSAGLSFPRDPNGVDDLRLNLIARNTRPTFG